MTDASPREASEIPPSEMTLDELRVALGRTLPAHAAFDGWSKAALAAAAAELGVPEERAHLAFPGGAIDMIDAWIASVDDAMIEAMAAKDVASLKIRERIRLAIWTRLEQTMAYREAVRRALAVLALPGNAATGARTLWRTTDAMWRAAGVHSNDFSYYTRRLTLGGVYSSTLLAWLNDDSEGFAETAAFLERRLEDVMRIERTKARWRKAKERRPNLTRFLGRMRYPAV